jgi:ubiquinone/menaquinone biosynthesis C-methylase UbiE
MTTSSHASLDLACRWPKAEKIRRLLSFATSGSDGSRLLEIGTGSGAIAHYFSSMDGSRYEVHAVDVSDQRQVTKGYSFSTYDGQHLPFTDDAFDIVISNHVIEHVGDVKEQAAHLQEIRRVLAPGGSAYIATPSRWQFVEPHFRLALLSWLPRRLSDLYVQIAGKGMRYDCYPLTHASLERMFVRAKIRHRNINTEALQVALQLEPSGKWFAALVARIPTAVLQSLYRFSPTMVYLLESGDAGRNPCPVADS